MKETIKKLVTSGVPEDRYIAMILLKGKSKEEIRRLFGLIHNNSHTIMRDIWKPGYKRETYRISEDCIIYFGYNMSIASEKHLNHTDLTIES